MLRDDVFYGRAIMKIPRQVRACTAQEHAPVGAGLADPGDWPKPEVEGRADTPRRKKVGRAFDGCLQLAAKQREAAVT